jgi:proteic killer suppression protein
LIAVAIQSFSCAETAATFAGRCPRRFQAFRAALERKLAMLHAARSLLDLNSPPGNRLEKLAGNLAGRHSIRVNGQFRLVFEWTDEGPAGVACTDYH